MLDTSASAFLKKHGFNIETYYLKNTTIPLGETVRYKAAEITFSYDEPTKTLNIVRLSAIEQSKSLNSVFASAIRFAEWLINDFHEMQAIKTLISNNFSTLNKNISNEDHANIYKKHFNATSLGYDEMMGGEMLTLDTAEYRKRKANT